MRLIWMHKWLFVLMFNIIRINILSSNIWIIIFATNYSDVFWSILFHETRLDQQFQSIASFIRTMTQHNQSNTFWPTIEYLILFRSIACIMITSVSWNHCYLVDQLQSLSFHQSSTLFWFVNQLQSTQFQRIKQKQYHFVYNQFYQPIATSSINYHEHYFITQIKLVFR